MPQSWKRHRVVKCHRVGKCHRLESATEFEGATELKGLQGLGCHRVEGVTGSRVP